jgi:RNA polymerase sigma factor (sigma-70 family)
VTQDQARARAAVETVIRLESARLIAGLARYTGDLGLAEDLAQDAVVAALEQWPAEGIPRTPGAWLMTVAKRRAVDLFRRNRELERRYAQLGRDLATESAAGLVAADPDEINDDLLRLVFTACHPVLPAASRVALTLRVLGGLTTAEIARAYLLPEATIAQRIVRAKRSLASEKVPFEVPGPAERPARLAAVLEVIYLIFNEGYSATAGDDWMRPALCSDAVRLARVLAQLMPSEPEVHGLAALVELQASRLAARTGPDGQPVLLLDQDRARWDRLLINRGLAALDRAQQLGGTRGHRLGADHRAVRGARRGAARAGGRAQPGRRAGHEPGPAGRPRPPGRAGRRAGPARLSSAAQRPRRSADETGPPGRGGAGVRPRGQPDRQRGRT